MATRRLLPKNETIFTGAIVASALVLAAGSSSAAVTIFLRMPLTQVPPLRESSESSSP
jgi:hypothetical protein